MNGAEAALLVAGSACLTAVLTYAVRRSVALDVRRRHHEVGSAVFLQLGVIFAVLLAFVFNEVWNGYNEAAAAIKSECGNLHGTAILADTLPEPGRGVVLGALATYVREVIDDEWPMMAKGRDSKRAREAFARLWGSVARLQLPDQTNQVARSQIMSLLAMVHEEREMRLYQMAPEVPPLLWAVLGVLTAALVAFVVFSGVEYLVSQIVFAAVFAASIVMILVVIRMLDLPFTGVLAIDPADFQETLTKLPPRA